MASLDGSFEEFDFFPTEIDRNPRVLFDTTGHSGNVGWTLRSSAIAIAILGLTLLLPGVVTRGLRPLAALGSVSLSAYLLHIFLVDDIWRWVVGEETTLGVGAQVAALIGLQGLLVVATSLMVWRWGTGPAERGLKALAHPGGVVVGTRPQRSSSQVER